MILIYFYVFAGVYCTGIFCLIGMSILETILVNCLMAKGSESRSAIETTAAVTGRDGKSRHSIFSFSFDTVSAISNRRIGCEIILTTIFITMLCFSSHRPCERSANTSRLSYRSERDAEMPLLDQSGKNHRCDLLGSLHNHHYCVSVCA
jgi:hypothetical protein